jgi:hypothetical protein
MGARYTLRWNASRVRGVTDAAVKAGMDEANAEAAALASGFSPVDTGVLRDSWEMLPAQRRGKEWRGGFRSTVHYARYVDLGTRFMAGQHMTRRAMDIAFPPVLRRIAGHWG